MAIKSALSPLLYRFPSPQLLKERLYLYMDFLHATREIPGAVVELGCYVGATAAFAVPFLAGLKCRREYVCVDTFAGFVGSQVDADIAIGTRADVRGGFSSNSKAFVRKLLNQWSCPDVELIEADVCTLDAGALPSQIAIALLDVDLAVPTAAALKLVMPLMAPGGIVLVDDCDLDRGYLGARHAVEEFAKESGRSVRYEFGMGIITA